MRPFGFNTVNFNDALVCNMKKKNLRIFTQKSSTCKYYNREAWILQTLRLKYVKIGFLSQMYNQRLS